MASTPPPLSPRPRRWAPADRSPLVEALNSLADDDPPAPPPSDPLLLSPQPSVVPSIMTTSPSPQRPTTTSNNNNVPATNDPATPIRPQVTGSSLAAQYDSVLASLDALNALGQSPTLTASQAPPSTIMSPPRSPTTRGSASPVSSFALSPPRGQPTLLQAPTSPTLSSRSSGSSGGDSLLGATPRVDPYMNTLYGLGITMGSRPTDILEALSEHTEPNTTPATSHAGPMSPAASRIASSVGPSVPPAQSSQSSSITRSEAERVATGFPSTPRPSAPPSPSKSGARAAQLIKMFESRSGSEPSTPPAPLGPRSPGRMASPTKARETKLPAPATATVPSPDKPLPVPPPVSSSAASAQQDVPMPPPKPPTPLSNVRSMIATWRARTAAETSAVGESSAPTTALATLERGGAQGLLRDRAWNVSIRRRTRDDNRLAEQAADDLSPSSGHSRMASSDERLTPSAATSGESASANMDRASFYESERPATPKLLTGEVSGAHNCLARFWVWHCGILGDIRLTRNPH